MIRRIASALGLSLIALPAIAGEAALKLADDPSASLVRARCSICHSVDYIQMNSRFIKRDGWEAEVRKMVKVMGAPVADDEFKPIVDYLTRHYGTEP
jgi:hypothetical protein